MALHDKLLCTIFSGLVQDPNDSSWNYKKGQKAVYEIYIHKQNKDICMQEFKRFIIKYNKSLYHIIGLKNFFIRGKTEGYPIYFTNKTDGYPIKIVDNNGNIIKKLLIIVNSKYFPLGTKSRKFMIKDLETFDKELSKNVDLKKLEPTYYRNGKDSINIFGIINLVRASKDIYLLFHELIKHPYFYLNKKYFRCNHPKRFDNSSIKLNAIKPGFKRFSFLKTVKYDTEENRLMKYILGRIICLTSRSIRYICNNKYFKHQPKILFIKSLKNLYDYLNYINENSFLKNISNHVSCFPPKLLYLYNYSLIYEKYKELFNNNNIYIENDVHQLLYYKYSYSIKPTSNLYELWTYVCTLRYLIHFGFNIYNIECSNIKITFVDFLNYGLKRGTVFYLKNKEGIHLQVVYNKSIDYDKHSPIYVFNSKIRNIFKLENLNKNDERKYNLHDKPDIRIDIFNQLNLYISSIILDAKCSDKRTVDREKRDIYQLLSYRYYVNYKRNIIQKYPPYFQSLHLNPIRGTFVLFAGKDTHNMTRNIFGIKYINLRPQEKKNIYNDYTLINIIKTCSEVINYLNNKLSEK